MVRPDYDFISGDHNLYRYRKLFDLGIQSQRRDTYLFWPILKKLWPLHNRGPLVPLISGIVVFVALGWWVFRKYVLPHVATLKIENSLVNHIGRIAIIPITVGLGIIAIRGVASAYQTWELGMHTIPNIR